MQGNHHMMPNPETAVPSSPRSTAAGLETWMSDETAETPHATVGVTTIEPPVPEEMAGVAEEVGPVNAAEALMLGTTQGARKLIGTDGAELVIDPEMGAYYFESKSLKPLAALLQQPASAWTPVYSEAVKGVRAANAAQPLARLRWYAGLIATRGILGRKLSRTGRYKLTHWPETEREFPKHFRIATAMLKEPSTPDEIAEVSGMPYDEVVDYINASYAGGRLEDGSGSKPSADAPVQSRRARLMARLNKPLFVR